MADIKLPPSIFLEKLQHDFELFDKINHHPNSVLVKGKGSFYVVENKNKFTKIITLIKYIFSPSAHVYKTREEFTKLLRNEIKEANEQLTQMSAELANPEISDAQKSASISQFRALQKTVMQAEEIFKSEADQLNEDQSLSTFTSNIRALDSQIKDHLEGKFNAIFTQDNLSLKGSLDFLFYIELMEDEHFREVIEVRCRQKSVHPQDLKESLTEVISSHIDYLDQSLHSLKDPSVQVDIAQLTTAEFPVLRIKIAEAREFLSSSKNEVAKEIAETLRNKEEQLNSTIEEVKNYIENLANEIENQKTVNDKALENEIKIENEKAFIQDQMNSQRNDFQRNQKNLAHLVQNFDRNSIQAYLRGFSTEGSYQLIDADAMFFIPSQDEVSKEQLVAQFMETIVAFHQANDEEKQTYLPKILDLSQQLGLTDFDQEVLYSSSLKDTLQTVFPDITSKVQNLKNQLKDEEINLLKSDIQYKANTIQLKEKERTSELRKQEERMNSLNKLLEQFGIATTLQVLNTFISDDGIPFTLPKDSSDVSVMDIENVYKDQLSKLTTARQTLRDAEKAYKDAQAVESQPSGWTTAAWTWMTGTDLQSLKTAFEKAQSDREQLEQNFAGFTLQIEEIKKLIEDRTSIQNNVQQLESQISQIKAQQTNQDSKLETLQAQQQEILRQIKDLENYAHTLTEFPQTADALLPYLELKQQMRQKDLELEQQKEVSKNEYAKKAELEQRLALLNSL